MVSSSHGTSRRCGRRKGGGDEGGRGRGRLPGAGPGMCLVTLWRVRTDTSLRGRPQHRTTTTPSLARWLCPPSTDYPSLPNPYASCPPPQLEALHDVNIKPLLSPGVGVAHVRLTASADPPAPLVVLTNDRAHVYSASLRRWLRVVDRGSFAASLHAGAVTMGAEGGPRVGRWPGARGKRCPAHRLATLDDLTAWCPCLVRPRHRLHYCPPHASPHTKLTRAQTHHLEPAPSHATPASHPAPTQASWTSC